MEKITTDTITMLHYLDEVYESTLRLLCREMGVSATAVSILLFLADNPEYYTAKDVVEFRAINKSIVSFNVDKLVEKGYLERREIPGNRRSVRLVCTEKARPMVEKGHIELSKLYDSIMHGMSAEDIEQFNGYLDHIGQNIMGIRAIRESVKK